MFRMVEQMSDNHTFCRYLLAGARSAAKANHTSVPKRITAISSMKDTYFVEAKGVRGEYVSAHCAFEAKSKYIYNLVDKKDASG